MRPEVFSEAPDDDKYHKQDQCESHVRNALSRPSPAGPPPTQTTSYMSGLSTSSRVLAEKL